MRESTSVIPFKLQGLHPRCLPFMLRRENRKMDYLKLAGEEVMKRCHACLQALEIKIPVGRREICPFCGSDLHCCLHCTFHLFGIYNECREHRAERVIEKDRSNFCDFFVFRDAEMNGKGKDAGESAKTKMKSLFKAE